ncbi:MAG: DUF2341 domain-containing protein [Chitinivibrionales bacterium]|nr:DUF2341 domain-containing protein [Chitinivibrionales bacterium]MBD3394060.1 DUF2341 domain-containing protein [Chitinivibrionales bacterium]
MAIMRILRTVSILRRFRFCKAAAAACLVAPWAALGQGVYDAWGSSAEVTLNTSATGADITGSVSNFPVLIRLTSSNFTFSEAMDNGEDIRFANAAGDVALDYEIERWNKTAQQAEVWVKVPTIEGGNSTQSIMMYWNKAGETSASDGASVFASSLGYAGVWHLEEDGNTNAGGYLDASSAGKHATGYGVTSTSDVDAIVGRGQTLDGTDDYLHVGSVGISGTASRTIVGWVKSSGPGEWDDVFGFVGNVGAGGYFDIEPYNSGGLQWGLHFNASEIASGVSATDNAWHYVAGTFDGTTARLYVDGVEKATSTPTLNTSDVFRMGYRESQGNYFLGSLDEIRVCSSVRSADWIKLAYMNQRSDDKLVSISASSCTDIEITAQPAPVTTDDGSQATFSVTVTGTSPTYQWQEKTATTWSNITGETGRTYTFTVSAADNGNEYRCIVGGDCGGPDTSTAARLTVSSQGDLNPLTVDADFVSSTRVQLTIRNFADLPAGLSLDPYVDTVCVWYAAGAYPANPDPGSAYKICFDLEEMQAGSEPFVTQAQVAPITSGPDSSYFFAISCFWHNPDVVPEFVAGNGDELYMFDTGPLTNPIEFIVEADYQHMDTTLTIFLANTEQIPAAAVDLGVWFGFDPAIDFTQAEPFVEWLDAQEVKNDPNTHYEHDITYKEFMSDKRTLFYAVALRDANDNISAPVMDTAEVGAVRCGNTNTLTATALNAYQIALSWTQTDSVRIWYGNRAVPLQHTFDKTEDRRDFTALNPPSHTKQDTISILEGETQYHFGLQVYCNNGLWSFVTENASDSATTEAVDPSLAVDNAIAITDGLFDPNTNEIKIGYTIDRTVVSSSLTLHVGVLYHLHHAPQTYNSSIQVFEVENMTDTLTVSLREAIEFDTTYYFSLWLRQANGPWAAPTDSSKTGVYVPAFKVAPFTFAQDDTLLAVADSAIWLRKLDNKNWGLEDVISVYQPSSSILANMIAASVGIAFSDTVKPVPPFELGIVYDSIPGAVATDLRVYRVTSDDKLLVEHDSYANNGIVWTTVSPQTITDAFIALADTVRPVLTFNPAFTDTSLFAVKGTGITNKFTIDDNVANVAWTLLYGQGNAGFEPAIRDTLDDIGGEGSAVIPGSAVSKSYGVRALLVVSDGVHVDTINVSRRVQCDSCEIFATRGMTWRPVRVGMEMDSSSVYACLNDLKAGETFYDTTRFRLFRWNPCGPDEGCQGAWREFDDSRAQEFKLTRGKVFWIKTRANRKIDPGAGVTTSLKDEFTIALSGRNWNDIALPFKFEVTLSDIVNATDTIRGANLHIIKWVQKGSTYEAEDVYAKVPNLEEALDTAVLRAEETYSVYVPGRENLTLRIPPIPPALSNQGLFRKGSRDDGWSIRLVGSMADGRGLGSVRCGFGADGTGTTFFARRPSFRATGFGFVDGARRIGSHAVAHEMEGGLAFELGFYNESPRDAEMVFSLDDIDRVPEGMKVRVFDAAEGAYLPSREDYPVAVASGGTGYRWIVIGTDAYLSGFVRNFPGYVFAFAGAWPNPFSRHVVINYVVPSAGLDELQFAVYDLRGRAVWGRRFTHGIRPGSHRLVWFRNDSRGMPVAGGVYLLRIRAREKGKREFRVFEARLTCLP